MNKTINPQEMDHRSKESGQNDVAADGVVQEAQETAAERAAGEDAATLQSEVERLQAELDQTKEQLMRQAAEFQNYRRRTSEEKAVLVEVGKEAVVLQLLDVMDDMTRTVEAVAADGATLDSLRQGVEMVHRKMVDEFDKLGVHPIETVGKPFDENLHEAMMRQPAPENTAPGTILHEIQRGYRMNDRVLRHSRVIVASDEAGDE